ncbi:hypothetical protein CVIRNUC_007004 [Coccomyxa viridis]|uniref:Fe2OG dioxygenase domain-containing protein n=1 Tax=Coccomyxa viridis TaxID=1274662 RepID=A0AAV1I9Q8_9CHLO|nr:hypothetical protein CVIRNUC_007004 [Coccomyxa viridis]
MAIDAGIEHPPIVDLSNYEERKEEITAQLMHAATTSGFFYVKNHGVPQDLIDREFEVNSRYFKLPEEVTASLPQVNWAKHELLGHEPCNKVSEGVVREGHFKWWDTHKVADSAYPEEKLVPGFKQTTKDFMGAMPNVYDRILSCFALGLGYPEGFFKEASDVRDSDNYSVFVVNYYPKTEGITWKPDTNRITPHTDETLVTLLFTSPGSAGLELAAGKDGKAVDSQQGHYQVESWHPCPHIPGCIVVNVGDSLQAWSDGVLKSNYHRVRMPKPGEPTGERYSMGYFVWPRYKDIIQGPQKKYPGITFARFMDVKSKGFGYTLSPELEVFEDAQNRNVVLGMPIVSDGIAAAS